MASRIESSQSSLSPNVEYFVNSIKLICVITLFVFAQDAFSQSATVSEFLASIPQPPKDVSEALRRCPTDEDVFAQNAIHQAELFDIEEKKAIARDSAEQVKANSLGTLSMLETNSINTLRAKLDTSVKQLQVTLQQITSSPSHILLGNIQIVGEDLDKEIKLCPKVGEQHVLDSVCVDTAEAKAKRRRMELSEQFLQTVNNEWVPMYESVRRRVENQQKQIDDLLASSKKPRASYRVSKLQNILWNNVLLLLNFVRDITRLAAQFNH